MTPKKGGLKRADRRQPEPLPLHSKGTVAGEEKAASYPHLKTHQASSSSPSSSKSAATRKRGQSSKSLARAKLEKGVEKADRLRAKASKRMQQAEMFLDVDIKRQLAASEKRKLDGSLAGSTRGSKHRNRSQHPAQAAPSEAGSDLASILSGGRGGTTSTVRGQENRHYTNGMGDCSKVTVASSSPSPAASVLPYALLSTSLAFFLFGFQSHEKSILLPLLPITLLISIKGDEWGGGAGKTDWEWAVLTNNLAVFSMWPLLQRDGLWLQYTILTLLWNWLIGYHPFINLGSNRQTFVAWFGAFVHLAILVLHLLQIIFPFFGSSTTHITTRYPDLFAVLNVFVSTPSLLLIWFWSIKRQLEVGFACGVDIFSLQSSTSKKSREAIVKSS